MTEQFLSHLTQSGLCGPGDRILLAVSGGLDSMVMLHLFYSNKFTVGVAHCNFKLRGGESDGDEDLVKDTCQRSNIPFFVSHFDTKGYAAENQMSIQMAARELRYSWFDQLITSEKYSYLATAHHLNDNVETLVMNLVRGSGLKSIPEKFDNRIRPLLRFSRAQLEQYAKDNNIQWREDSSNSTDDYSRNFIRHRITPLFKQLNPGFENGFKRTIEELNTRSELSAKQLSIIRGKFVTESAGTITIKKSFADEVENAPGVMWELIKKYDFNFDQVEDIVRGLNGVSGKQFLSPGYQLVIDRDTIIITPHHKLWDSVTVNGNEESVAMGSWEMLIERPSTIEIDKDKLTACLDSSLVAFPLTWRVWKDGDHFHPLGMTNSRKLSDFLIDNKISRTSKKYVTVLESATGDIIWVVGYRIDNRYKITDKTTQPLKLTLGQYFI